MKSIGQVKQSLPREFVQRLYERFPLHLAEKILAGYGAERYPTLRANTLKTGIRQLMQELAGQGVKFERVPWYDAALVIKNRREGEIEQLEAYQAGRLYLQSLSSMIPPLVLDPRPGERILDMTAAPGSKTTQMAMMMQNAGYILANDANKLRVERLKYNVALQGAGIVEVSLADGRTLGEKHPEQFDRVLLDAPCSGEGLFSADDPRSYRHWSLKEVGKLSSLQKKLFSSAFQALKPGGTLVYSTCTLSPEENEMVVDWALSQFEGRLRVLEIPLQIPGALKGIKDFGEIDLCADVEKALRILPSRLMEGFFVCRFKKSAYFTPASSSI
ncbi:MAG: RsmB/NOP family class I SAM-dependent RNA methyltransferase [Syntrophothermus sp.]